MGSLLFLFSASFSAALIFTALVRFISLRLSLVDAPDSRRKLHARAVPRTGGVAIAAACVTAFVTSLGSPSVPGHMLYDGVPLVLRLLPSSALIFGVGLLDDLLGLRPWHKLLVEIFAAALAVSEGFRIASVAGHPLPAWLGALLTVAWLIGCTNAFNLIDGMDGLATGLGLFATASILLVALFDGNIPLAVATAPLVGALLAFLLYNFNPACIFLGDSGSLLVGFLLGCYAFQWSQKSTTLIGMSSAAMVLAIPLADTVLSVVRRYLRCRPIFGADRGHVHHRLLARGLTTREAVTLLYAVAGSFSVLSVLLNFADPPHAVMVVATFCIWAWVGIDRLDFVEFGAVRQMFARRGFRRQLNAYMDLQFLKAELEAATSIHDIWCVVRDGCRSLGFTEIGLSLADSTWWDGEVGHPESTWKITMHVGPTERLTLARPFEEAEALGLGYSDPIRALLRRKLEKMKVTDAAVASDGRTAALGSVPQRVHSVVAAAVRASFNQPELPTDLRLNS